MIRLHVVDDQIIQGAACQNSLHIGDKLAAYGPVGGVKEDGLFVERNICVIGYAVVQGMDVLKQGKTVFIRAYPVEIVGNHTEIMHKSCLLCF